MEEGLTLVEVMVDHQHVDFGRGFTIGLVDEAAARQFWFCDADVIVEDANVDAVEAAHRGPVLGQEVLKIDHADRPVHGVEGEDHALHGDARVRQLELELALLGASLVLDREEPGKAIGGGGEVHPVAPHGAADAILGVMDHAAMHGVEQLLLIGEDVLVAIEEQVVLG